MAQKQVYISVLGKMAPVVEEAKRVFEDAEKPSQALTRALYNWYYNRQDDSKRGALARIEQKLDRILAILEGDKYDHAD